MSKTSTVLKYTMTTEPCPLPGSHSCASLLHHKSALFSNIYTNTPHKYSYNLSHIKHFVTARLKSYTDTSH